MDKNEVKRLIGKKIISFNLVDRFDEQQIHHKEFVVEVIEGIGKDWVVTRGKHPRLTKLDNPIEEIKEVLVEEGEPGERINDSQYRQLQEVMKRGT